MKVDLTPDECEAIQQALEHFSAYLYSQNRDDSKWRRLEELFRKLARSE